MEELGTLRVPSGRLAISDAIWLETPLVVSVPPGSYAVRLTSAILPERYELREKREAYLSVVFSEEPTVSLAPAVVDPESVDWDEAPADGLGGIAGLFGVPTSNLGTVAIADERGVQQGMPADPDTWYDTVIAAEDRGWFAQMGAEDNKISGALNTKLPRSINAENIVIVIARLDQRHPILETRDAEGRLTGIHIDMLVIGELCPRLGAFEGRSLDAITEEQIEKEFLRDAERDRNLGFFARLFGA
ncbi:DUF4241 domain-containing protein [Leucobacter insecticola]|uniref:DUF4241 domain-containing protein n=1 Tax=Leucobacter insecticola TaxID=2714934 RepID=A0A6G8FLF3_9MICO|nr:DUF4241 domain-containing protein [Leucobacter insecticola]QIM17181.1 DUF4241 domain-containing protein [Leucobacter insecticola]